MNPPSRLSVPNIEGFLCYKPEMKGSCFDVWVWKPDAEISSILQVCVAGMKSLRWRENISAVSFFFLIFLAVLGLCCTQVFSGRDEWGLLPSCSVQASHCRGFSFCRPWAQGWAGFSSCGSWAPEHSLSSCGPFWGMWDLPRWGMELVSSASKGEFLITGPRGNP